MCPANCAFWLGSVAIAGMLGTASVAQQAPTSRTAPCLGFGCPIQPAAEPLTKSETRAPNNPYDWRASFAAYPVGKGPRPADGNPDLQGLRARAILTPIELPGNH